MSGRRGGGRSVGGGNRGGGRGGGRGVEPRGGGGGRGGRSDTGRGGGGGGGGRFDAARGGGGRFDAGRGGGRQGGRDGGGGRQGGRDGGGGRQGGFGRGGRGGGVSHPQLDRVLTNILPATVADSFCFYLYTIDTVDKNDKLIDSRSRRSELFGLGFYDGLLSGLSQAAKKDTKRMVFFAGSFFYSAREIPGLEPTNLPYILVDGTTTNGDTMRCLSVKKFTAPTCLVSATPAAVAQSLGEVRLDTFRCNNCALTFAHDSDLLQHCRSTGHSPIYASSGGEMTSTPASPEVFVSYVSLALDRAMSERLTRWGKEFVDRDAPIPAHDRQGRDLGVSIFEAISLSLGIIKHGNSPPKLMLTCDLRAKVIRNISVLDAIYQSHGGSQGKKYSRQEQEQLRKEWIGSVVIYRNDHKCYTVTDLNFDHSPDSLPVPSKGMSHTEYFASKGVELKWPGERPMIEVEGRQKSKIYLPAELVSGNELDPKVREMLPQIASFKPDVRTRAIDKVKTFLQPGTQRSTGGSLLPAIGVILSDERIVAQAKVLPAPMLIVAGVQVPKNNSEHWAPMLSRANFNIDPTQAIQLNVVVFYHTKIGQQGALKVYGRIRDFVNSLKTYYRFPTKPYAMVEAGDKERHWGAFEKHFVGTMPENLFVVDFIKPYTATDPAYPVIKHMLAKSGHLSQFVSFKTYAHDEPREMKKSDMILQGVARQILQKAGFEIWWAKIPDSLPLPAMFIGVDVFHAPMVYDPKSKKRGRKASCAAIVVTVVRKITSGPKRVEAFSKTFSRTGGKEYQLGDALEETVSEAKQVLKVEPKSVIVWRDGMPETAEVHANEEINGVTRGLKKSTVGAQAVPVSNVPLAYIVCQKRISTKLLTPDGENGAPSGTMVVALQGLQHQMFYINGRAPPYSTPKPVRFLCMRRDEGLNNVPMGELTWSECHNYPNWAGPVKVPAVCQMAHKLAEMGGSFVDGGVSIDAVAYKNKLWFL